jgi:hypothetical protein
MFWIFFLESEGLFWEVFTNPNTKIKKPVKVK